MPITATVEWTETITRRGPVKISDEEIARALEKGYDLSNDREVANYVAAYIGAPETGLRAYRPVKDSRRASLLDVRRVRRTA